ncbi:MAG TPA: hypothetical protein VFV73_17250 [Streptosporangiaceae bacterium]|nr:hypothetical protein [Streptosporangiaceae bacterium]
MVDATLVRYHPDSYGDVLARQAAGQRRITEDTFAGLRFVRNRMGYDLAGKLQAEDTIRESDCIAPSQALSRLSSAARLVTPTPAKGACGVS